MKGVENLRPLTLAEWPLVRDITIPISSNDSGGISVTEGLLTEAVANIGEPAARRLWDDNNRELLNKLFTLFSHAENQMQLGNKRFRLELDGMAFRAQLGTNAESTDLTLRVLPDHTPHLNDLRMPPAWKALFLDQGLLNGGLILVAAPNGQGKTTTISAVVRSRLEMFAGFANTCEDPVELPLQQIWGEGVCVQRSVDDGEGNPGEGYYRALLDTLRQFPAISGGGTMLMVGEIRDAQTAAETLKAAANGHLVIATIHARSTSSAVRRLVTLCAGGRDNMDSETVRDLLADSLRGVFLQRLLWQKEGQGWGRAEIQGDVLWSEEQNSTVGKAITDGNYNALAQFTKMQSQALASLGANGARVQASEVRSALKRATG